MGPIKVFTKDGMQCQLWFTQSEMKKWRVLRIIVSIQHNMHSDYINYVV